MSRAGRPLAVVLVAALTLLAACRSSGGETEAPTRSQLATRLAAEEQLSRTEAACVAGRLVRRFDDRLLVGLYEKGVRALPAQPQSTYIQSVVACTFGADR